jgi:transcriptional regulator with XRE-family HTH domain
MTELIKIIAERIKELRVIEGISAESLAQELSIPIDVYNAYENGQSDIPVGILYKIANKFNVELSMLLSGENPRLHVYCVVRKGKGLNVERRKLYKHESLAFNFIHKKAEPFMVTIDPNTEIKASDFNSHPGQEFNYMIEGSMELQIENHVITLNEGDSVYFNSEFSHAMKPLNGKAARFLAVIIA